MNRLLLLVLLVGALIACGGTPPTPTVSSDTTVSETVSDPETDTPTATPLPAPTDVVLSDGASATVPPPPTPTSQPTAEALPTLTDEEVDAAVEIQPTAVLDGAIDPTMFSEYSDELLGVALQRPVDWTTQFPVRSEITSYVSDAALQNDPTQSYGRFAYQAVSRFEGEGQPDLAALLLTYLQQNVSAEIPPSDVQLLQLGSNPAAVWRSQSNFSDGSSLTEQEWLLYSAPVIFRISTAKQVAADSVSYESDLQTMLQSMRFTEPSLLRGTLQFGRYEPYIADNLSYTSANNGFAFRYPQGGLVSDAAGNIDIVSDASLYNGFQEGEAGYAVYYRRLPAGSSAEPSLELADSLVDLPDNTARQVDRNTVTIDRFTADAILYRNRPDNRFTYELGVYVVNTSDGQAAIISVKLGTAAPAIWNEGVIGSILYGQ